jgi:hypothetical protein
MLPAADAAVASLGGEMLCFSGRDIIHVRIKDYAFIDVFMYLFL